MQRQILNIEVRIITVVFTRRSSVRSGVRLLLLGPGRFLDGLWSIKAGSEHQSSAPSAGQAPAPARVGLRPDRRRDRAAPAPRLGAMGNHHLANREPRSRHRGAAVRRPSRRARRRPLPSGRPRLLLEMGPRPADGRRLMIADHQINLTRCPDRLPDPDRMTRARREAAPPEPERSECRAEAQVVALLVSLTFAYHGRSRLPGRRRRAAWARRTGSARRPGACSAGCGEPARHRRPPRHRHGKEERPASLAGHRDAHAARA